MLHKKIVELLNIQINREFYSSYLYLDTSNYFYDNSLNGYGNWFDIQTQEENAHAILFVKYMQNNGERAVLEAIAKPDIAYKSFKHAIDEAYKHELFISKSINNIYWVAYELRDFKTMQFLDWFVKEQGEEEKNVDELCKRFELFGNDPRGLYMLDSEMAARTFTPPSLVL